MAERRESHESPEQWRWAMSRELDQVTTQLAHLHACFETRDEALQDLVRALAARVTTLEALRLQIIGAVKVTGVVVFALLPLLWWVLTKLVPVLSALLEKQSP